MGFEKVIVEYRGERGRGASEFPECDVQILKLDVIAAVPMKYVPRAPMKYVPVLVSTFFFSVA